MWYPQGQTVFVKKSVPKEITDGGIVLPNAQQELTLEGTVILVSDGFGVYKGKKVLFSKFSGSEVKVGSESLLIMRVEDILAVWTDETL